MEVFFSFCIVCRFFKSETSRNYSTFDQQDFVKTQSFNSNDIIVMSYYVIISYKVEIKQAWYEL